MFAAISPVLAQTQPVDIPASAYGPAWTGFYVGAAIGVDAMIDRTNISAGGASLNVAGLGGAGALGSIYGGVDYKVMPRALVGVLAELSYGGLDSTAATSFAGASATASTHADLGWALLLRAGVLPTPSTLVYAVGGYAGQNMNTTASASVGGASASFAHDDVFNGWTIGTGLETLLRGGWSTKLEYRYSQYEQKTLPGTTIGLSPSTHAVRLGLTYRFGAPGRDSSEATAAPSPPVSWTGFYAGVAGGAGASTNHLNAMLGGASASSDVGGQGLLGGVFAGADYQFASQALVGVMGDLTWSGLSSTSTVNAAGGGASVTSNDGMSWSVLGRLGYLPIPSALLYAAGGLTGLTVNTTATVGGASASMSRTDTGWTIGPGVEVMIADGWSTRLEYRYSQFAQGQTQGPLGAVTFQPSTQTIRAGLSYRFGVGH